MANTDILRRATPGLLTVGLLAGTCLLLHVARPPRFIDATGIAAELPRNVGRYIGTDLAFCQHDQCLRSFTDESLQGATTCPACGAEMSALSLGERRVLPADTVIRRRLYRAPRGPEMLVTVLLGSQERTGIHRPQMCLEAQGMPIEGQRVIEIPRAGAPPLKAMLLDIRLPGRPGASAQRSRGWFCYWYAGGGRETPSNLARLWWTAVDNVVHGEMHRWVYVSVSASRLAHLPDPQDELTQFIGELYPQIRDNPYQ